MVVMLPACFLSVFTLLLMIDSTYTCGGCCSSSCSWTTCTDVYGSYYPSPSLGTCVSQWSRVSHVVQRHSQGSNCPGDTNCSGRDRHRYYCSCLQVTACWWAGWGAWTGNIAKGTCGKQTRYRRGLQNTQYTNRVGSCHGVKSSCTPNSDSEQRRWCNCRKANSCTPTAWSSWLPAVSNGQCKDQTRYQDRTPYYTYIEQKDHCGGIVSSCPGRMTEPRKFCRCEYKECIKGEWTSWEIASMNHRNCPNQQRWKRYREITKYKDAYHNCDGVEPKSCPKPTGEIREKEVTCPKIPTPENGILINPACNGVNSGCQETCGMKCNNGYKLEGNKFSVCLGTGKWDRKMGTCKDNIPPVITCPNIGEFYTEPNKDFRMIDLPDATATDNSGELVYITKSHSSPLKVLAGTTITVKYTATDQVGLKSSCSRTFEVKDKEPPKVVRCPKNKLVASSIIPREVFWEEPEFHDNVEKENVIVIRSNDPGSLFHKGVSIVTYTARDKALNSVQCSFTVEVENQKCPTHPPPKHGTAQCNVKKDGVNEAFICTVACKKGYWFLQGKDIPKLFNFYLCAMEGDWKGQNVFNPMAISSGGTFENLPKDRPLWPDCAAGVSPDGAVLNFQVYGGSCKDESTIQKLKEDFINAIRRDIIINSLFCGTHQQNCAVENIVAYCATRKRRSGTSGRQIILKFSYSVRDKTLSTKLDINKLGAISVLLNNEKANLIKKVQASAPNILKDYATSVSAQNAAIACEPGYEYSIVSGTGDVNSRTKCLKCPPGTYYKESSRKCTVCQTGYYQNEEGQLLCKKCPAGTTTIGTRAQDFHECKGICKPGTYSKNGLETCLGCPIGTYQPMSKSMFCIKCPSGKATKNVGSVLVTDCMERP